MRKEPELIELIDQYLSGKMSEADKTAFEKKMKTDPSIQKEVELQKQVMKGIERTGLKQSAKKGLEKYKLGRNLRNWGLGGLTVAVIALSSVFVYNSVANKTHKENAPYDLPELNEQGEKLWSDADKYLEPQLFDIDSEKDTVVETNDGIIIAIPAGSFLDPSGKPATGEIRLEVKEALKASDIMKAGLNTKSGDKLLETGGMFYINARQDGNSLKIDPKNALYAEIPTDEVKPNMQLFEGKRLADGSIDWINPKPIRKDLIPVDITSLNFYPPNYLDSVKAFGYDRTNKKFTDSLYYSFAAYFPDESEARARAKMDSIYAVEAARIAEGVASGKMSASAWNEYMTFGNQGQQLFQRNCSVCHSLGTDKITGPGLAGVMTRVPGEEWMAKWIKNNQALIASGDAYAQKISKFDASAMTVFNNLSDDQIKSIIQYIKNARPESDIGITGINPAKVKAIWNEKFNNTLLATKEFEERLPLIHQTCSDYVLDMYIENIDKDLSSIDSMVAHMSMGEVESAYSDDVRYPEFLKFAQRGDGNVKNGNKNVEMLKSYYEKKSRIYTEAVRKTVTEFWDKQYNKTKEADLKRDLHDQANTKRIEDNYTQELDKNITEAYRQLGQKKPARNPDGTYGVHIERAAWYNIDKYVIESTMARTTLDYTDPQSGKKAVIKYEPLTITVKDATNYDRVLVYLLPEELSSFMRVEKKGENYEEKLNELMTYKMVCLAYKGEESFYFSQDNVKPGSLSVSMIKTTNEVIKNNVDKLSSRSHSKALNDELAFMAFEKEEAKRQAFVAKISELTNKIRPVIFPCWEPVTAADTVAISENFN